jgi:hypothetical protein
MMDAIERTVAGKASPKELFKLKNSYMDEAMAGRILEQVALHGEKRDAMWILNAGAWDDLEAAQVIRAAVSKEIEKIIVTPGAEKPLWMSTEWGKLIGQFKSFAFASKQRVLMSAMQDADMGVFNGMVFMASLGMLGTYAKNRMAGRDTDKNWTALQWVEEGVDRAGLTGWFMDANNMLEKLSGERLGLGPMLAKQGSTRYADRNPTDALLGPTAGRLEDLIKIGQDLARLKTGNGTVKAMRRAMPMQNLFYVRGLFDMGEQGVSDWLGVEPPGQE